MLIFITGLVIFFAIHLVRMLAPEWRRTQIKNIGENKWKGVYSIISIIGLGLIIWGYSQAKIDSDIIYTPPSWGAHVALLLVAIALILVIAANLPTGKIKQAVKHPFLLAVKLWAFAHLLANGDVASIILFGSFLVYAVWNRIAVKRRGGANPVANSSTSDMISIVLGLAIWAILVFGAHNWLFGVNPIA